MRILNALLLFIFTLSPLTSIAALDPDQPLSAAPPLTLFEKWARPMPSFKVIGNLYYVGTDNLSVILIKSNKGLILIDGGMPNTAEQIKHNIEQLGFTMHDIKYILNSHARMDQAGGFAKLKKWTGAKIVASPANARQLAKGGKGDFALGDILPFPNVHTDIIIHDGESITLGNQIVTAHATPGHLPGSTSWSTMITDGNNQFTMVYADSLATPEYHLINNKNYPTLVEDIQHSFSQLANLNADIFIANKGQYFHLQEKYALLSQGDKWAFVNPFALQEYVKQAKKQFDQQRLTQERLPTRPNVTI